MEWHRARRTGKFYLSRALLSSHDLRTNEGIRHVRWICARVAHVVLLLFFCGRVCVYGAPIPISVFCFIFLLFLIVVCYKNAVRCVPSRHPIRTSVHHSRSTVWLSCSRFPIQATFFFTLAVYVFRFHLSAPVCVLFTRSNRVNWMQTHTTSEWCRGTRNTPTHIHAGRLSVVCGNFMCAVRIHLNGAKEDYLSRLHRDSRLDERWTGREKKNWANAMFGTELANEGNKYANGSSFPDSVQRKLNFVFDFAIIFSHQACAESWAHSFSTEPDHCYLGCRRMMRTRQKCGRHFYYSLFWHFVFNVTTNFSRVKIAFVVFASILWNSI